LRRMEASFQVTRRLIVIPERCSGCRICELVCAIEHLGVNNPKKARIRAMVLYPQPVIRMPIVCLQCGDPKCAENCPTGAINRENGLVVLDEEKCVSCQQCVTSCPFGAMFVHDQVETPFKCDLCGGDPQCVKECPKGALVYQPEHVQGQAHRRDTVLRYAHMREVVYEEEGEPKRLRYAEIETGRAHDED